MLETQDPTEARTALGITASRYRTGAVVQRANPPPSCCLTRPMAMRCSLPQVLLMIHNQSGIRWRWNRSNGKHTYMKMFGAGMAAGFQAKVPISR